MKLRITKLPKSLKQGKKARLKVIVTGKALNKVSRKVRYISTDTSTVRVSKKGIVTGVTRGTCSIYCVAQNGLYKKIRVRVK